MNFVSGRVAEPDACSCEIQKRGRYKYSGSMNQQKYIRKAKSSQVCQYFVRKSKGNHPCGTRCTILRFQLSHFGSSIWPWSKGPISLIRNPIKFRLLHLITAVL